ncbi:SDR family NAD(P)-dependent oxidoreductase [Pseudomaricurvus sp. HS19]|uniref:SDR family NAD(P)-dependent oxidoreductase n=1 Tax=Pseudomaricurvus sp. HS19 TaxID=2692626 RepID=UPI0013708A12|nr:SDR family NAD(P)-dependent oxidoreductase [Pseudomaricurvus sp. HS19]MYM62434.1 SDR family NAD(P)-dependent oxidoreductase [Pseudomaricurvus sp. HS19]
MSEKRFDGQVAVITGAGRGLGKAYALLLGAKGAKVVVNDLGGSLQGDGVDVGPAQEVVNEIIAAGGEAIANTDSVATPEGGQAIINAAINTWGRIDILIHNAGNVRPALIRDMSYEDFNSVLDVHLKGAFHVVKPAMPLMCDAGYGRIVLTSSIGGLYGNHKVVNYGVSKAGMIGLCNVAALEGAEHNVTCNLIVPGAVTRMAEGIDVSAYPPMGPELVAPVVGWLSHESCSVSGEMFVSIAGRVAKAFIGETEGVYQPEWTIDDVETQLEKIGDTTNPWILPVVPAAHVDHIRNSFAMAVKGSKS